MLDLIIDNVRCFRNRHQARIAPITILTGENSAGKSTFLAACRLAWDAIFGTGSPNFNEDPFWLGSFSEVASSPSTGEAGKVRLGFNIPLLTLDQPKGARGPATSVELLAHFSNISGQPVMTEWTAHSGDNRIRFFRPNGNKRANPILELTSKNDGASIQSDIFSNRFISGRAEAEGMIGPVDVLRFWSLIRSELRNQSKGSKPSPGFPMQITQFGRPFGATLLDMFELMVEGILRGVIPSRPYALAPVRSRVERTYDPVSDMPRPEGSHIPMLLARLKFERETDPQWGRIQSWLSKFGEESGLFTGLDIERFGADTVNNPFQVKIKDALGYAFNLIDVGYGIGQVLPVLVDAIANSASILLLQQPEVHLHPKAQAAVGSLICNLVAESKNRTFIIESHSDFLIDRIRIAVRAKSGISPDDVNILFFSKEAGGVKISSIAIDSFGNLCESPTGYRAFFLEEERRLLLG